MDLIDLNEWEHTVKIEISGVHVCHTGCSWNDRFLFVSALHGLPLEHQQEGLPPAQAVTIPPTAQEVNADITLPLLTVLLVLLITAAASYAVFIEPVSQLVVNAGALILGIWGIRTILVGQGTPPGATAVDLSLSIVILFLLVAIAVRMLRVLWERGELHLPRPSRSRRE